MKKRGLRRDKKGLQLLGMPFSMILSIILIATFLLVAFFAIRHFLEVKKCVEIGSFLDDFQTEIDSAWNSQSSSKIFKRTLPSKMEYVCFVNLSARADNNVRDKEGEKVYEKIKENAVYDNNFFFYPLRATDGCIASTYIKHVNTGEMDNPHCITVQNGEIEIKIEKDFFDALVRISGA